MRTKVLVVGSPNMGLIVYAPRLPRDGETLAGQSFTIIPGGKDTNQVVAVARPGVGVAMIGCLGDDAYGDQLYRVLQAEDIDCRGVERVAEESSGMALIVVDDSNQNAIVIVVGGNGHLSPVVLACHEHLLEQTQVVVCQLESPLEMVGYVLRRTHVLDRTVILNLAPAARSVPTDQLPLVDYLVPSETKNKLLCRPSVDSLGSAGRATERPREVGVGRVVVTLSAQGTLLMSEGRVGHFLVARVKVLDTTAADGIFVDGFVTTPTHGLDEAVVIHFGQAVAAISVTRLDAQTSIPLHEEVERALAGEAREGRCHCYRRITPAALSALRSQVRIAPRLVHPFEGQGMPRLERWPLRSSRGISRRR